MSAAIVGAALGSALGGLLSDRIGRKLALLAGDGLFTMGALCMAFATSATVLISGNPLRLCRGPMLRAFSSISYKSEAGDQTKSLGVHAGIKQTKQLSAAINVMSPSLYVCD